MPQQPFSKILRLVEESLQKRMAKAAEHLRSRMVENASLVDHSLDDLKKIGHPYKPGETSPHKPSWLVHKQTGDLADNIEVTKRKTGKGVSFDIGIDSQKVPHINYIILGTEKMVSRDFVGGTWQEEKENTIAILRGETDGNS